MKRYATISIVLIMFLAVADSITAQENIIISDNLAAHAELLKVNVEYLPDNNLKFSIGDYAIVADQEQSGTYSDTKERLLGLRVVTKITKTIAFTISNPSYDTAMVFSEERNRINTYYPNEVLENFFLDEITGGKFKSFATWITINGDTNTTWTLYIPKGKGKGRRFPIDMLLTDGVKYINIASVSSDLYFDYAHPLRSLRKMPAMGAEFMDDGKSICAVQFDAGATTGYYPEDKESLGCKAWMHQQLDAKTKLVLAAAMSTLLLMNNSYLALHE